MGMKPIVRPSNFMFSTGYKVSLKESSRDSHEWGDVRKGKCIDALWLINLRLNAFRQKLTCRQWGPCRACLVVDLRVCFADRHWPINNISDDVYISARRIRRVWKWMTSTDSARTHLCSDNPLRITSDSNIHHRHTTLHHHHTTLDGGWIVSACVRSLSDRHSFSVAEL